MGFYILLTADDKEALCVKIKDTYKKKRKVSIKKRSIPRLGLGGLHRKKRRKRIIKYESSRKISQETVYGTGMSILLSLYPKKFGYSLGGYSYRERCRAPDKKKSTEEG
jgi:hypothetical protein